MKKILIIYAMKNILKKHYKYNLRVFRNPHTNYSHIYNNF